MGDFMRLMETEKRRLERQIQSANTILSKSPDGTLSIRKRKKSFSYYWNVNVPKYSNTGKKQINITKNKELILQLTEKMLQRKVLKQAQLNLFHLKKCISAYHSSEPAEIAASLGHQYRQVLCQRKHKHIEQLKAKPYPKAPFDSRYHIHETDCGELVRSKSEQIILNTLCSYSLIVHYEEEFLYSNPVWGINRVYPDFTIILPDGRRILWEHFGRLDNPDYCQRAAAKLNLYQQNGFVIGKNLIITMDDDKGNVSSSLILDAIHHYILPHIHDTPNIN